MDPSLISPPEPPHLVAVRTDVAPRIDGKVDEEVWKKAAASSDFTQAFPNDGAPPSEQTTMRIMYDDNAIYVAFECQQIHSHIVEYLTRRDRAVNADRIKLSIGSRHDRRTAYLFTVNVSGVLLDGLQYNDTQSSNDWDENWEAKTARTPQGWSAEFRIPMRILRFASAAVQSWDLQARRYIPVAQEVDEWAYIPREVAGEVSQYGYLDGLTNLRASNPIEFRPFVLGQVLRRDPATTQLARGVSGSVSGGLDLKWHLSQALTLDATFNPDFAQVEADQVVLNLTKYETYYPEKRPFFLEGFDMFTAPLQLLYTRRIGQVPVQPALRTSAPFGEQLVDGPLADTIYGAAKITGQLTNRWSIGTLQAVTAQNNVDVQLANGSRQERLADPLSTFNVLRLKRSFDENGYFGVMMTATTRAEPTNLYPLAPPSTTIATPSFFNPTVLQSSPSPPKITQICPYGAPNAPFVRCFPNAYVGAVDWQLRSNGGDWVTGGQATATVLDQGAPRQVPDGTIINPGDIGPGAYVYVNKEGGQHWVGDTQFQYDGRKLDFTDLGYADRSNDYRWAVDGEWHDLKPWWIFNDRRVRFEYFGRTNTEGLWIGSGYQLSARGNFKNHWRFYTQAYWRPTYFDDREVGDGTALQRAGLFGYGLTVRSDTSKVVSAHLESQTQAISDGFAFNGSAGVLMKFLPQFDLELLPTVLFSNGEPRFAEYGPSQTLYQYIFGKLDAKSVGLVLRSTYTFLPNLTLQAYGQLFLASGHYSDYTLFQPKAPGAVVHLDELQPYTTPLVTNPDFQTGILNLNVVLRWEYVLGSTAYLVYTRSQVPSVMLQPGEVANLNLASVNRAPASDQILLKISYFLAL